MPDTKILKNPVVILHWYRWGLIQVGQRHLK